MPNLELHPRYLAPTALDPSRLLQLWIALGALTLIALPGANWHNHAIGWLPYWLVLAPALSLALARRHRIAAALAEVGGISSSAVGVAANLPRAPHYARCGRRSARPAGALRPSTAGLIRAEGRTRPARRRANRACKMRATSLLYGPRCAQSSCFPRCRPCRVPVQAAPPAPL